MNRTKFFVRFIKRRCLEKTSWVSTKLDKKTIHHSPPLLITMMSTKRYGFWTSENLLDFDGDHDGISHWGLTFPLKFCLVFDQKSGLEIFGLSPISRTQVFRNESMWDESTSTTPSRAEFFQTKMDERRLEESPL